MLTNSVYFRSEFWVFLMSPVAPRARGSWGEDCFACFCVVETNRRRTTALSSSFLRESLNLCTHFFYFQVLSTSSLLPPSTYTISNFFHTHQIRLSNFFLYSCVVARVVFWLFRLLLESFFIPSRRLSCFSSSLLWVWVIFICIILVRHVIQTHKIVPWRRMINWAPSGSHREL